jgi:hypothetical protein
VSTSPTTVPAERRFESGTTAIRQVILSRDGATSGPVHERLATIGELRRGHGAVLRRLSATLGRWLVWVRVEPVPPATPVGGRHLWFIVVEDGSTLIAECASNHTLEGSHRLTDEQEEHLARLGWHRPDGRWTPHWSVSVSSGDGVEALCDLVSETLIGVFGLTDETRIVLGFQQSVVDRLAEGQPHGEERA